MYIIGFNGPPRSGKDTLANELVKLLEDRYPDIPVIKSSLSMPMRKVAFAMLGEPYTESRYEEVKDKPHEVFRGSTLREFMIAYSEQFAKPTYGKDIWARALLSTFIDSATELKNLPGFLLVPDIGFAAETQYFIEKAEARNFINCHVYRDGFNWNNDSRDYVFDAGMGALNVINVDPPETAAWILRSIQSIYGWNI